MIYNQRNLDYIKKMLQRIKQMFSNRSTFDTQLSQSTLMVDLDVIYIEDLIFIIRNFEMNENYITEYFKILLDQYVQIFNIIRDRFVQYYLVRSKGLLTAHLILHELKIGEQFATGFLAQQFPLISQTQFNVATLKDKKSWLTENIQIPYYHYLQRLSANIQVFHCCKQNCYPTGCGTNIQTKMIWLFKISNMANFGFAQMDIIKKSLVVNSKESILKEIVLVYWGDIMVYYNFLSAEVTLYLFIKQILMLLEHYRHLAVRLCLQFYELYTLLIELRNKVRNLYKFRSYFDYDRIIKLPNLIDLKKVHLNELQKHVGVMQDRSQIQYKNDKINNNLYLCNSSQGSKKRKNNIRKSLQMDIQETHTNETKFTRNSDRDNPQRLSKNHDSYYEEDFDLIKKMTLNNLHNKIHQRICAPKEIHNEHDVSVTLQKETVVNRSAQVIGVLEGHHINKSSRFTRSNLSRVEEEVEEKKQY